MLQLDLIQYLPPVHCFNSTETFHSCHNCLLNCQLFWYFKIFTGNAIMKVCQCCCNLDNYFSIIQTLSWLEDIKKSFFKITLVFKCMQFTFITSLQCQINLIHFQLNNSSIVPNLKCSTIKWMTIIICRLCTYDYTEQSKMKARRCMFPNKQFKSKH